MSFNNYRKNEHHPVFDKYSYGKFDLQLFAGEKTEEATQKRREETRDKGQVAKSQDLNAVIVMAAAFLALSILGAYMYNQIADFMLFIFTNVGTATLREHDPTSTMKLIQDFLIVWAKTTIPVMIAALVGALVVNYYQVGVLFTVKPLEPDITKLSPIKGFKRMFSLQSLTQLIRSIIKIIVVVYFLYNFAILKSTQISMLTSAELFTAYKIGADMVMELVWRILLVLFILAILDYLYQIWQSNKDMRMSKQEVKEEYKQSEGDPKIKAKIKQKQREMAMRRMMQEIPQATVVVTNPIHLAIALKYEKGFAAPLVVAKGKDFLAERIKEIAREHHVIIVENKPLAQALYPLVEVGDAIPPELYQAVAEVLAYVYGLKKHQSAV
jgi:flagellar biosynthetic protein FlhB